MNTQKKRNRAVIAFMAILMLFGLGLNHYKKSANTFSSEIWRADLTSRHRMANDIVTGKIVLGKSKDEALNLLGEPSEYSPHLGQERHGKPQNIGAVIMKYDMETDVIGRLKKMLCLDLENDTVILVYIYHQK